jgi:hypothetical protein
VLELPVHVEETGASFGLQLSPVPASTVLRVQADRPCDATGWWITDACGRPVAQQPTNAAAAELDVAHLSHGMYILHATFDGRPVMARFVVAH